MNFEVISLLTSHFRLLVLSASLRFCGRPPWGGVQQIYRLSPREVLL